MAKKKGGPKTGKKSKHRFSFKEKAAAPEKPSPFAIRSGKLKFDILGRKVKGDKGNVVKAREAGHTKRKNTLLKEYEASGKSNAFIDRRFGEDDASMTPEERAIGRLARTRLRQIKRGSGYNLNDGSDDDGPDYYDDEGPITLTHGGKPIDEREEERRSAHAIARGRSLRRNDDDSDDDMNMDAATTGALHFGGGDDDDAFEPTLKRGDHEAPAEADGDTNDADDERRKTKKEVMDELIDKSKYHKAERAKQRERDEDLLDKLDDEFKEISGAGLFRAALSKGVGHLKPDGWERGKKNGAKDAAKDAKGTTSSVLEKKMTASAKEALALAAVATDARGGAIKDDYDRLTRELVLESRGQATDRMRTNEEVDAAEAAALETAERARLKRMNAVDSDDDGISDDDMGPSSGGYAARRAKAKRQAERAAKKGGLDGDEPKEKKKKTREDGRDGGDDLDGNFDLSGSDEDASGDEDGEEEASEESESDDGETALDDKKQMTKAFKKEANKMAAELDAGKKRLRKLGILEDGGDVEDSDDDDEDGDDEEDEADDSDDDDEGDDSDSGDEDEYLQMERMRKELEKRGVDTKQFLEGAMRGEGDDDDEMTRTRTRMTTKRKKPRVKRMGPQRRLVKRRSSRTIPTRSSRTIPTLSRGRRTLRRTAVPRRSRSRRRRRNHRRRLHPPRSSSRSRSPCPRHPRRSRRSSVTSPPTTPPRRSSASESATPRRSRRTTAKRCRASSGCSCNGSRRSPACRRSRWTTSTSSR